MVRFEVKLSPESLRSLQENGRKAVPAEVVVGTNVLAHVPDILDFIRGAAALLDNEGTFVIEAPYLRDLVESVAYDTIYHEHVSYLSVTALARAYSLAGLVLTDVELPESL